LKHDRSKKGQQSIVGDKKSSGQDYIFRSERGRIEILLDQQYKNESGPICSDGIFYFDKVKKEEVEEMLGLFRHNNKTIRMKLSKYVNLRIVPELRFFYDDTLDNVYRIEELLNSIKKNDE
jgi:hypothetical protein